MKSSASESFTPVADDSLTVSARALVSAVGARIITGDRRVSSGKRAPCGSPLFPRNVVSDTNTRASPPLALRRARRRSAQLAARARVRYALRPMRFQHVRIAAVAHALPEERVSSAEIERLLAPVYERLRLREGRLELMSGIRERRFWPRGMRASAAAAAAGAAALARSRIAPAAIGCLIHGAVSRDFLEPATASVVHAQLGIGPGCLVFDLSNACLGVLDGMLVIAGMIERGEIE